jgi:ADP-ribosylglycohydrolase
VAGDLDAVYGCLIGGAVGDALGAPVENRHYADIRKRYGKVTEFMPYDDSGYGDGGEPALGHEGAVLDLAIGAEQDEAGGVRPCREDERFVAAQHDDDLRAFELLALVRAALDGRLDLAARAEVDPQQVRGRPRAGVFLGGDDAADQELFGHSRVD